MGWYGDMSGLGEMQPLPLSPNWFEEKEIALLRYSGTNFEKVMLFIILPVMLFTKIRKDVR